MSKSLAIDCDGVLVDSSKYWYFHLRDRYEQKREEITKCLNEYGTFSTLPYNLAELFEIPEEDDPKAFWKSSTLYEGLKPIEGSVETLKQLKKDGWDLSIVSRVTGDHAKSKCDWLNKHFPFVDAYLLTGKKGDKEKAFARCDVIIDDSLSVLNLQPDNVKCLWYRTNYVQRGVIPNREVFSVNNWNAIYNTLNSWKDVDAKFIKELLE